MIFDIWLWHIIYFYILDMIDIVVDTIWTIIDNIRFLSITCTYIEIYRHTTWPWQQKEFDVSESWPTTGLEAMCWTSKARRVRQTRGWTIANQWPLSMFPCSIARRTGLISYFFSLLFPKPLLAGTALWKLQNQKSFPKPVNWFFHQGSDSWFANHQTKGRTGPFAWSQTIRMPLSDYWQWSTVKGQCVGNSSSKMTSPSDFENPEASSLQLAFKRQGGHLDYRHRSEGSLGMPGIWTISPWMNRSQFCAWTPNRECNRGFDRFWQ
jgi:hypothetical protein